MTHTLTTVVDRFGGVGALIAMAIYAGSGLAAHVESDSEMDQGGGTRMVIPMMSPERGKKLFVDKGCVACHAINGVGGHDAPPMDAHRDMGLVNPFDFAAKMWNHAPAMVAAQEDAFGEMVYFSGEELADIIAFVHDDRAQHGFSESDLTPTARKMMAHDHGGKTAPAAHAGETGHGHQGKQGHAHPPGTQPHED